MLLVAMLIWIFTWLFSDDSRLIRRTPLLLFGVVVGWVMQRSRFCMASAIREPFFTGDNQMAKSVLLLFAISVPLVTIALQFTHLDPYMAISSSFWIGALFGGLLFGFGMTLAGGCATGLLWRSAEGGLKVWVGLLFFAWSGSLTGLLMNRWDLFQESMTIELVEVSALGRQVYLPDVFEGYAWAWGLIGLWLIGWWLLIVYVRRHRRHMLR